MKLLTSIKTFGKSLVTDPHSLPKKISGILLATLLVSFLTCIGLAPLNTSRSYREFVNSDSLLSGQFKKVYNHPDLESLVREKSFKEALLGLSENVNIQLIVDLKDSLMLLSIKGVVIHEIPLEYIRIDPLLSKLPIMEYTGLFSYPLEVRSQYATIVKEPVVIRQAPRDSAEASLNAYEPDTLIQKPAFLLLHTDHQINLIFEQDSNPGVYNKWVRVLFWSKIRLKKTGVAMVRFLTLRKLPYEPTIILRLPARDLRAIYRALPDQAYLVLSYGSH